MAAMNGLPILLRVTGRRCIVIGAGAVARRRAQALHAQGAAVVVIAPEAHAGTDDDWPATEVHPRRYATGDLAGAWLVVVATDDPAVNDAVSTEAAERGVLVNRADDPEAGDLTVLAHRQRGPVTVAVSTDGISARTAGDLAEALIEQVDDEQLKLLEAARPWRARLQQEVTDAKRRQALLRELIGPTAQARFRDAGPAGYKAFAKELLERESIPSNEPPPERD